MADTPMRPEISFVEAYVLIQTQVGMAAEVVKLVAPLRGVISAQDVTGPYDIIVRCVANDIDELGKIVISSIQDIHGITRTLTCPVVHM